MGPEPKLRFFGFLDLSQFRCIKGCRGGQMADMTGQVKSLISWSEPLLGVTDLDNRRGHFPKLNLLHLLTS